MMNDNLKHQIEILKESPGCYLMYDKDNRVIYIGKAKNLKKRVSQYFLRPQSGKTFAMVTRVNHFETILTNNEKEALILEMNLIQKYHPRYNILLMDDKHYPYIELHKNIEHPYISIARNLKNKKSVYFGPYPSSFSAFQVIDIINSIYPLRKCNNVPSSPCLYYHINNCLGPCINKVKKEDYKEILDSIESFLRGNNSEIVNKLKDKIKELSEKMDFEEAKNYKEKLDSILYINEKQNVEFLDRIDRDFIAFYLNENYLSLVILIYRKGLLIGKKEFFFEIIDEIDEFISNLLLQYYASNQLPKEIYLRNEDIEDILKNYLNTTIKIPSVGKMLDIINIAFENAKNNFQKNLELNLNEKDNLILLEKLGEILNIPTPYEIELFDNSHLQGTNAIGAMVHFTNGEENKRMNRKFNISQDNKKDDLSSMKEVIFRRYSRLKEEKLDYPDLIIVDGGEEQIKVAKEVLEKLEIKIPLVGLVKNEKHMTRALMDDSFNEIMLDDKELFKFLSRMQERVHQFAISTHIKKRTKSMYNSIFDDIKGIGNKRKEVLIKSFPTLLDLKKATLDELKQYLPNEVAQILYAKLKEM